MIITLPTRLYRDVWVMLLCNVIIMLIHAPGNPVFVEPYLDSGVSVTIGLLYEVIPGTGWEDRLKNPTRSQS